MSPNTAMNTQIAIVQKNRASIVQSTSPKSQSISTASLANDLLRPFRASSPSDEGRRGPLAHQRGGRPADVTSSDGDESVIGPDDELCRDIAPVDREGVDHQRSHHEHRDR